MTMRSVIVFVLALSSGTTAFAQPFWVEDFDAPNNQSAQRLVSGFLNSDGGFCTNDYFVRTNLNIGDHIEFQGNFTNLSNSYYWRAEDFDSCIPATGDITWSGIDIAGRQRLVFSGRFGAREESSWESTDFLRVQWRIDGGSYQNGLCFAGGGGAGSDFTVDADCTGPGDAASQELRATLSDFSFTIPASGSLLDLQLLSACDSGAEEFAFDFFRLEEALFVDGFESGTTAAWSSTVP